MKKRGFFSFRRGDLLAIVLVVLLALAAAAAFLPASGNTAASMLLVFQDGRLVKELPLHTDTQLELSGDYSNTIVIRNGRAAILQSDCPGGDCIRSGWITGSGRSIVCLPNRVELRISDASGVDFVVR